MPFSLTLSLAPQTELDAVNQMLLSIGQSPVNTLSVSGIKDVSFARLLLHNASREVQTKGWWFNTDEDYSLAADVDGKVAIPSAALSVDPTSLYDDFVERYDSSTRRFWDRKNHTFVISKAVKVDITWMFAFETLPECVRAYVAHRAARVFQASAVGSRILYEFTKERELELLAEVERQEHRDADLNLKDVDERASRIFHRLR